MSRCTQLASAQRKIGQVEQRALHAERNLELTRDALRVQADLAAATSASVAAAATLTLSPGTNSRFPVSKHDLPLASSPVLRAPPPARWGSGPVPAGGGVGDGDGAGTGVGDGSDNGLSRPGSSERGQSGAGAGMGGANGGVLVGRTQEMGVRFAMDTLRYSDDAEVVVFMLHLVQVGTLDFGGEGWELLLCLYEAKYWAILTERLGLWFHVFNSTTLLRLCS